MYEQRPDDLWIVLDCAVTSEFPGARHFPLTLLEHVRELFAPPRGHARNRVRHEVVAARVEPVRLRREAIVDIVQERPRIVDFASAEAVSVVPRLRLVHLLGMIVGREEVTHLVLGEAEAVGEI